MIADGRAGNDLIDLSGVNTISAHIFGGEGQDTIFGTQASDIIYADRPMVATRGDGGEGDGGEGRPGSHVQAGGGDDLIYGSAGRDYLDAGTGRNQVHTGQDGGEGRDGAEGRDTTLGATAPDTTPNPNEFAPLDQVLAHWDPTDAQPNWLAEIV